MWPGGGGETVLIWAKSEPTREEPTLQCYTSSWGTGLIGQYKLGVATSSALTQKVFGAPNADIPIGVCTKQNRLGGSAGLRPFGAPRPMHLGGGPHTLLT